MKNLTEELDCAFTAVIQASNQILEHNGFSDLFTKDGNLGESPGMLIIRSVAKIEQCFGGITARLWDDPFEWTLPEIFSNETRVRNYLNEADDARKRGFLLIQSDEDLSKHIPAPEQMKTVFAVLLQALVEANNLLFLARAEIDGRKDKTD